jgi:hypothetical protein
MDGRGLRKIVGMPSWGWTLSPRRSGRRSGLATGDHDVARKVIRFTFMRLLLRGGGERRSSALGRKGRKGVVERFTIVILEV